MTLEFFGDQEFESLLKTSMSLQVKGSRWPEPRWIYTHSDVFWKRREGKMQDMEYFTLPLGGVIYECLGGWIIR
jgi:hypothetical protein